MRVPRNIDHLIYAAPSLEEGMDAIASILGIRPVIGGRHAAFGTHNALLAFGSSIYFEVIAPDSDAEAPPNGVLLADAFLKPPHLATWVLKCNDIPAAIHSGSSVGLQLGPLQSGSRMNPDGTEVSWMLSDPYALPFSGAVPFLIDWGNTPHPATRLPNAGALLDLNVEHPDAEGVRAAYAALDINLDVGVAPAFSLTALIDTPRGEVELK